jgi:hypothetical protein
MGDKESLRRVGVSKMRKMCVHEKWIQKAGCWQCMECWAEMTAGEMIIYSKLLKLEATTKRIENKMARKPFLTGPQ